MHTVNIQISLYVNISDEPLVIVYAFCAEFRILVSNICWNSKNVCKFEEITIRND